ncbi:MAG: tail fiber domain-containing protein [Planctomycetota bacterium]
MRIVSVVLFVVCCAVIGAEEPAATWAAVRPIEIAFPKGGEVFSPGQTQTILLHPRTISKPVLIELSRDGGQSFTTLGTINNTVPDRRLRNELEFTITTPGSTRCVLRASYSSRGTVVALGVTPLFTIAENDAGIPAGAVATTQLADGAVTNPKLAPLAVTNSKLAPLSVTSDKISSAPASSNMVLLSNSFGGADWAPLSFQDFTGVLPVANGGTGSSTQNFVDLTTNQLSIGGNKGFSGALSVGSTFVVEPRPNSTGPYNLFIGAGAGAANTSGLYNFASGYHALSSSTTANYNVAIGAEALYSNTTGYNNVASGANTLYSNTTGSANVANGYGALYSNTTGFQNVANGHGALYSNTTGYYNVASGVNALSANTTGNFNVANGCDALSLNTTGESNIAIGITALPYNTTGSYNVASGNFALYSNKTGDRNIGLGYGAGLNLLLSNNIAIGNEGVASDSGIIRIGTSGTHTDTYLAGVVHATGADRNQLRLETTGTGNGNAAWNVYTQGSTGHLAFQTTNGNLTTALLTQAGVFTSASDGRYKTNIATATRSLERALALRPVNYDMKDIPGYPRQLGFIAQELRDVVPEVVVEGDGGRLSVAYGQLVSVAIGAVQDLKKEKDAEIAALRFENAALKKRLERIEKLLGDGEMKLVRAGGPMLLP